MKGFEHILNWKLRRGSHKFPGTDGGTCINEAAVVAAGFEYRPIRHAVDMPSCFSRPICNLAMMLNDGAGDVDRQRLLPFVTRLACADSEEIEQQRRTYINSKLTPLLSTGRGIEILEGALAIGRQADPLAKPILESRLSAMKAKGDATRSWRAGSVLAKAKAWLEAAI